MNNRLETIKPIDILLVDDNPGDVRLTLESMAECKIKNKISIANDGIEAMAFLRQQGIYAKAPRPDLILLDLNMPRKNGLETLADIKTDIKLKHIPVVVLTISDADQDILETYQHHANCYIIKPLDLDRFVKVIKSIEDFWLSIVKLPPKE